MLVCVRVCVCVCVCACVRVRTYTLVHSSSDVHLYSSSVAMFIHVFYAHH